MAIPAVNIPRSPFVDQSTGRVSKEWLQWLLNPSFLSLDINIAQLTGILPTVNGGTGISDGSSGGILYFANPGTLASSPALTQYGLVYGGGSGGAPGSTATLLSGEILIGVTGAPPSPQFMTGDAALSATGVLSLSAIITAGTFGSGAIVPVFTIDDTGRITAVTPTAIAITTANVSGLGTLAIQNASAVAITGGSIDSVPIGATTPAAATFTLSSALHFRGSSSTPGIATGAGAGTTPTIAIVGTDSAFRITLTTGTLPIGAGATICTVTFASAYGSQPHVVFSPANANAALLSAATAVFGNPSISTFVLGSGTTGLTAGTQYIWECIVIQ